MNFKSWYKNRGMGFVLERMLGLYERYNFNPQKSITRIERCMEVLRDFDVYPTFAVPGILVEHNPSFFKHLQDIGAEIIVHGYNHVDLKAYPPEEASQQLQHAAEVFRASGLEVHGFRCPYLSATDDLLKAIPSGFFEFSSNKAVYWEHLEENGNPHKNLFFNTLSKFYDAKDSSQRICLPWMSSNMVEIPVCVPDDLQLYDGLQLDSAGIAHAWVQILHQTNLRGELFTLLFHTELASLSKSPFIPLIREAKQIQYNVWFARLQDINNWWWEKSKFKIEITPITTGLRLTFTCTPRATILARGVDNIKLIPIWDNNYYRIQSNVLDIPTNPCPLVGLAPDIPDRTVAFLQNQGYILDTSETARSCGIYLSKDVLSKLANEVELVKFIETSTAPLVRIWHWPDGAKSALSITGDLDALSLFDYTSRIFVR